MMVILGLGANIGERLSNLRQALQAIKKIPSVLVQQVSPIYRSDALLPANAPTDWDKPYLNLALRIETDLAPLDLLQQLKIIEHRIGRKPEVRHWGPRVLDIDMLAWDDVMLKHDSLTLPHQSLEERPFALWPLADVAPRWRMPTPGANHGKTAAEIVEKWGSRFTGEAPLHTQQIAQRLQAPQLVGILNVTPDSFSDGGHYLAIDAAVQQIHHLIATGAEIIDIGAESTSPSANPITAAIEWQRLEPVLMALQQLRHQFDIEPRFSIDTHHATVAAKALALGVDWINDVSGLDDPAMRELILQTHCDCIVMHHLSLPERRDHVLPREQDTTMLVYEWAEKRLEQLQQLGIARDRIIFDPGIGFGKMAEQSLLVLKHIQHFHTLGTRLLIGHSRKTFLSLFTNAPFAKRDTETLALSLYLAKQQVDYLRVHDVDACARALKVMDALVD